MAKVEWHPGELCPRMGFIVTIMARPAGRVVAFYNPCGTAEQHIEEGKDAVIWIRFSCHCFASNAVRLQLHALAYNLANFLRTLFAEILKRIARLRALPLAACAAAFPQALWPRRGKCAPSEPPTRFRPPLPTPQSAKAP